MTSCATIAPHERMSAWCRRRSRSIFSPPSCNSVASAAGCSAALPILRIIERLLRDLSLWDKRDTRIVELSGGMKRRVMIAKALSHEPDVLFLDEPTAGVDVNLRRDMWALVRRLRAEGVTVILTTHYIEEAEEMADRVGVINNGRILLVEDKAVADAQTRQASSDARVARAAAGAARGARRLAARARGRRAAAVLPLRRVGRRHRRADASAPPRRDRRRLHGSRHHDHARSRTFSSILSDAPRETFERRSISTASGRSTATSFGGPQRTIWQSVATPVITTALYFVVFGGGDRLAHQRSRRRELRRVHRAGPHHAVAPDPEHLQRLDRHLLSQIHRHDLRAPVGAAVVDRGGLRLCRRGGDQVDRHRARHSGDRDAVRAGAHRPSRSG